MNIIEKAFLAGRSKQSWESFKEEELGLSSTRTRELQEEVERLRDWKESMLKIWSPIVDWGQSKEAGLKPGTDITSEVLRRAKEYPLMKEALAFADEELSRLKTGKESQLVERIMELEEELKTSKGN